MWLLETVILLMLLSLVLECCSVSVYCLSLLCSHSILDDPDDYSYPLSFFSLYYALLLAIFIGDLSPIIHHE